MNTGILVPAAIAGAAIGVRAIVGNKRAPYPYEYMSWGLVYGAAGAFGGDLGEAFAWAYLVAMLVAPAYADVWKQVPIGKSVPHGTTDAKASPAANSQGLPKNG